MHRHQSGCAARLMILVRAAQFGAAGRPDLRIPHEPTFETRGAAVGEDGAQSATWGLRQTPTDPRRGIREFHADRSRGTEPRRLGHKDGNRLEASGS